jgi:hypothetical protein
MCDIPGHDISHYAISPTRGAAFGLLGVHAVSSVRAGVWPVAAATVVVISLVVVIAAISLGFAQSTGDRLRDGVWFGLAFLALGPVWLAVGGSLLARSPAGRDVAPS